jgi:hypothetical protein
MLVCERGHEKVAVVVVGLHPKIDALVVSSFLRGFHEVFWEKLLLLVEVVTRALINVNTAKYEISVGSRNTDHINEYLQRALPVLHELRRVMLLPLLLLVLSKVPLERLLAPRAVDGVGNWGES